MNERRSLDIDTIRISASGADVKSTRLEIEMKFASPRGGTIPFREPMKIRNLSHIRIGVSDNMMVAALSVDLIKFDIEARIASVATVCPRCCIAKFEDRSGPVAIKQHVRITCDGFAPSTVIHDTATRERILVSNLSLWTDRDHWLCHVSRWRMRKNEAGEDVPDRTPCGPNCAPGAPAQEDRLHAQ